MPSACIATGCTNISTSRRKRWVSFYRLPLEDKELLQKWLVNLRRTRLPLRLDRSYVCSDHFEPECFGRDIKVCRIELVYVVPWAALSKSDRSTLSSIRLTHYNYRQCNKIQYNSKRVVHTYIHTYIHTSLFNNAG